jgi:hypothetical protein
MTTCPLVCVAKPADCPTACSGNLILCPTGSCEDSCGKYDLETDNPCPCPELPVACPVVVDYYDECLSTFMPFYENNTACLDNQLESTPLLSYTGPYFDVCYVWISVVTFLVVGWCYYNEKLCPNQNSTSISLVQAKMKTSRSKENEVWVQTGYKRSFVGTAIYILVHLTFAGIQFLLFLLTIFYYMQQGAITRWPTIFSDTTQVLEVFILVWMIGFPWTMVFQLIPTGIESLFLRRCPLSIATHVAIVAPTKEHKRVADGARYSAIERASALMWCPMDAFLRLVFSYPYNRPGQEVTFCPIQRNKRSNQRFLYHRMRRYVWDESSDVYVPGRIVVGKTLRDFANQRNGLSSEDVELRSDVVGPNRTPVAKPTFLSSLRKEFNRAFYVYQNFILWTWYVSKFASAFDFFIHSRCWWVCSACFQLISDALLYKVSQVEGEVKNTCTPCSCLTSFLFLWTW